MNDFVACLIITLPVVFGAGFIFGYWRGAMMAKKVGLDALDEYHEEVTKTIQGLRK